MFGKRSCCRSPLAAAICGFFTTVCAKESAEGLEVENSWDGNVEPVWGGGIGGCLRFQRTSVPRQVRVEGCAHKAGVDNSIVHPYLSSRD